MSHARTRADMATLATGSALVAMFVTTIVVDAISGGDSAPGADATAVEVADFVASNHTGLYIDAAARFLILALVFLPISVGLAHHVRGSDERSRLLARAVPLLAIWLMSIGGIANSTFAMLIFEGDALADEPGVTRILLLAVTALFLLAMLPHGAIIGVVSHAGRRSGSLPTWLSSLGYAIAGVCLLAVLGMPTTMGFADEGPFGVIAEIAYATTGIWYGLTGIVLILAWRRRAQVDEPLVVSSS